MARAGPEKPVQPRKMQNESIKYEKKKSEGYIIKCLLTKLGRVGWENVWLSVMTKLRSIRPSWPRSKFVVHWPSHSDNK